MPISVLELRRSAVMNFRQWYIVAEGETVEAGEVCAVPEGMEYITLDTSVEGKLHVEGKHKIIGS